MKQILLAILSLLAGLSLFICSFLTEEQSLSLLLMALSVIFLLVTIVLLSYNGAYIQVKKENAPNNLFNQ